MKSMPASSAMRARRRQSAQLASQRSGTLVAERPEEQLAPNTPTLSVFALYMPRRSRIDPLRTGIWLSLGSMDTEIRARPYTTLKDASMAVQYSALFLPRVRDADF